MHARIAAGVLLLLVTFCAMPADAYDQFGTYTVYLFSGVSCGGWKCDNGCVPPVRFPIAQFTDGLLSNAKLRSVEISWETGNDYRGLSFQTIPTVTLDLNGIDLDTQTLYNLGECGLGSPQTYLFSSTDFPAGFPGYVRNGVNVVYLTLRNGGYVNQGTATISLNYELPPPVEFNVTDQAPESDRRVLLSNLEPGYPYPYFQSLGAQDGNVRVFVRTRGTNTQYQSGIPVYLRILDPPDPAPYANPPFSTLAQTNDNQGPAAKLEGNGIAPAPNLNNVWQGTSGSGGELDFTLALPFGAAAGDNYQVQASFDPQFPIGKTIKSGILTAWKRIFVEKHVELRNGIAFTANSSPGDSVIHVGSNHYGGNQRNHRISRGDQIVLVHAPAADRRNALDGWYREEHNVADVAQDANGGFAVTLGTRNGNTITPEPLLHAFGLDPSRPAPELADWIARLSGATLSSADYFDAPNDLVSGSGSPFPAASTEYIILPDGPFGFVPLPHFGSFDQRLLQPFAEKWCRTGAGTPAAPNHQLLVIADSDMSQAPDAGVTLTAISGQTSSWVWRGSIDANVTHQGTNPGGDPDLWAAKTSAHELAHEWKTNTQFNLLDHCPSTTRTYDDPTLACLLAAPDQTVQAQRTNGIARFHMLPVGNTYHSEYLEIRKYPEPFVP